MSEFRFDDVIVAHDAGDLQDYLRGAHHGPNRPLCLCVPQGVPMYVARLADRYLIKRMPDTGHQHSPDCASYEPPAELSGLGEVKGEAIRENVEDGTTTLRLDFSLSKTGGKAPPETQQSKSPDTVRSDGAKLTLRGTLHYLWEEAGLNRWVPAMAGKRSWAVVRRALTNAAHGKVTKNTSLADLLYVPEPFTLDEASALTQRRIARLGHLTVQSRVRKLMMVVAEAKEITTSRYGFKLVAKHLSDFPFMLNEELHTKLQKAFVRELALWDSIEDSHLVFLATFGLSAAGVANIEAMTVMVTTRNWIPFEHTLDKALIDDLTNGDRRFVKGLRYNLSSKKPLACAVLSDVRPQPVALYVLPPDTEPEYDAALQQLVNESAMTSWVWRTTDTMPALPPTSSVSSAGRTLPAPVETSAW
ncbi:DUF1173 domain-containing protein [Trinickia violacea]|uniref:DUF1173 domain-containing protein n=1 Tax=Trinickia violacea TaxID=2571746 RepID=A0A4P8J0F1_9BURK|nr:DUF1173 domain-containing protein [Trinickia violacea]QCP55132.1 DUF1173 domain-containing protein [Trinickia violacea]